MVLFARKRAGKKNSNPSTESEAPQVPGNNNGSFSCNAKFLGSSLVGLVYKDHSILDVYAGKKRGTKRVRLTFGPELILCASKKSPTNVLHVHSTSAVRDFFVHPQKQRVFGYMYANSQSGTVQLFCFRTPKKSSSNGEWVRSAWLKVCQSQGSAQLSSTPGVVAPSSLDERTEAPPTAPPLPPLHFEEREGQLLNDSAVLTPPIPKPRSRVAVEGKDSPVSRLIPAPRRKTKESESQLNGVTAPIPKPRSRVLIGEKDTPAFRPIPAPRKKKVNGSLPHNSLMSTPPTPKPRPHVATEENGASPLEGPQASQCASSTTTALLPPVPPPRNASLYRQPVTEEPIYDTVPAEFNVDANPRSLCDECGDDPDHDHAKEMLLLNKIHRVLRTSFIGISDISGITIHTRIPLQSQTEIESSGSEAQDVVLITSDVRNGPHGPNRTPESWVLPDREPPNWPTPDPATIPCKPETDVVMKELREGSTPHQSPACIESESSYELVQEEMPEELAGNPGSGGSEIQEQAQLVAQFLQSAWTEMMEEGMQELRRTAREIISSIMMDRDLGQEKASASQKDLADLPSTSASSLQTSNSGTAVKQPNAAVPVEPSGTTTRQQSRNPPRNYSNMMFVHHSTKRGVVQRQPLHSRTDSQQSKTNKTATKLHPHPVSRKSLCPSFSDSQIVKGAHAFKPSLSGYSGMFHQAAPKPDLAGPSGVFDPVQSGKQEQPVIKEVPRRRRRRVQFKDTVIRQY